MVNKKDEAVVFETNDLKGIVIAWLNESSSSPDSYLTKEGMSYLNGYVQANNTLRLIKIERYEKLLQDYEDLILRYEKLKNKKKPESLLKRFINILFHK